MTQRRLGRTRATAAVAVLAAIAVGAWYRLHGNTPSVEQSWGMLDRYCVECHNADDLTANIAFEKMAPDGVADHAAIWEAAVRKLRGRLMPPPGMPQPSQRDIDSFSAALVHTLDAHAREQPNPGHVPLHRLNRSEYQNAVRDVLGVTIDATALLPQDAVADGFENVASVLKISPTFLDQYINAARKVSLLAVGDPAAKATQGTYLAPKNQNVRIEGAPLGTRGGVLADHYFAADGEYVFNMTGLAGARYVHGVDHPHTVILTIDDRRVFEQTIGGPEDFRAVDQGQYPAVEAINKKFRDIRVPVESGVHRVAATFVARSFAESDEVLEPFDQTLGMDRIPKIDQLEILGPFGPSGIGDTQSRRRIFTCKPAAEREADACAHEIVATVARRAFRRPVTDSDLAPLLAFYETGKHDSGFETGIQKAIMAILASPKFLYRGSEPAEGAAPGTIYALDDLELASRLSFFLWSSVPDDELLATAVAGKLHEPAELVRETRRLLADPKSKSLTTNFAFQWLTVGKLDALEPRDPLLFPNFDDALRVAFKREMEYFVDEVFRQDRSVLDLLTANYTYVNERLAAHYGIAGVVGDEFRRVTLTDPRRFGLLGKGSILTVTSYPQRTSPVLRGQWILENLYGTPPAAPPPSVLTVLAGDDQSGFIEKTVRQRLQEHRVQPSCNQCHGVMDPLGLALENFDAIGAWRDIDRYARVPVDAAGELAGGTAVKSPADLRAALLAQPDKFVTTMTEKLLTFALGRTLEYYDMPTVRSIVRDAARNDRRFSSLVLGIVESAPFRMAMTPPAAADGVSGEHDGTTQAARSKDSAAVAAVAGN